MTQPSDWWSTLTQIPATMANTVKPWLPQTTLQGYQAFLNMMYHYTLHSEARLHHAAAQAPNLALQAFYNELADEEAPHYLLAAKDLKFFGKEPSTTPPPETTHFHDMFMNRPADQALAHLGALYALESVADHLAQAAQQGLGRLGLSPQNASFVLVHLQADEVHGAQCKAHCQSFGTQHSDLILEGAQQAARAWINMHRCLKT